MFEKPFNLAILNEIHDEMDEEGMPKEDRQDWIGYRGKVCLVQLSDRHGRRCFRVIEEVCTLEELCTQDAH